MCACRSACVGVCECMFAYVCLRVCVCAYACVRVRVFVVASVRACMRARLCVEDRRLEVYRHHDGTRMTCCIHDESC